MFARLIRHRAWLVLVPLVAGLVVAGALGARMVWEPTQADGAGSVECWDGSLNTRAGCERPTGVVGLEWVFPSFHRTARGCHQLPLATTPAGAPATTPATTPGRPTAVEWRCRAPRGQHPPSW